MAEFGSPAGPNYTPPDGLKTLGEIMSFKRNQQALQSGALTIQGQQQELQGQAADVQVKQQDAQQRGAGADFFKNYDFSKRAGPDGTVDINDVVSDPRFKALGDSAPDVLTKVVAFKNAQLDGITKLASASQGLRSQAFDMATGLQRDKDVKSGNEVGRGKVLDAFDNVVQANGQPGQAILGPMRQRIATAKASDLPQILKNMTLQNQTAESIAARTMGQPVSIDKGGSVGGGVQNPETGALTENGPEIGKTIPPGWSLTEDPVTHNKYMVNQQTGESKPVGVPFNQKPPPNAPTAPPQRAAGEGEATVAARVGRATGVADRVNQAQVAANNTTGAQDALTRAKAILESPSSPDTGSNFESVKSLKNLMSGLGIDTKSADNMNTLTKNLARYEAARATQSGLGGTDAARELAHAGSPNTSLDNKALLGVVRQSMATEKANAMYASIQSKHSSDPDAMVKNEADYRNIPHLIEAHEFGMMKSPQDASEFLAAHKITAEDMKKSRDMIKEFGSR